MKEKKMKNTSYMKPHKNLPLSNIVDLSFHTFICIFIILPSILSVVLPISIFYQVWKLIFGSKKTKKQTTLSSQDEEIVVRKKCDDDTPRQFDLILFGATGFTGKMAATYIAKQYGGKSFTWALAGRRGQALHAVREELSKIDADLSTLSTIVVDSNDEAALNSMASNAKVVITAAGPFSQYGSLLVKCCATNGTHYCDITGETDWVREMIDKYSEAAVMSGARIVHFCGHDCIPWDLCVQQLAKALSQKDKDETLTEVRFYDELNMRPSGGTLQTALNLMLNRKQYKSKVGYDPLLLVSEVKTSLNSSASTVAISKGESKTISKIQTSLSYSQEFKSWVGPFIMAMVMCNCVRRSNALKRYSPSIVYKEAIVHPSLLAACVTNFYNVALGICLFCPPVMWVLRKTVLPKPGEGPSEKEMDEGFLTVTGFGMGSHGHKVRAEMHFSTDAGYRDTARMLVESGLVLALQSDQVPVGGGVFTPATCQGELLLHRLIATGTTFTLD